jgi:hypothetical protein
MLASSIADVPLGFKGLDESPYHVQATAVRLNKRRNAKNPDMPIPSKAIEVGSGTALTKVTAKLLNTKPAVVPVTLPGRVPTPADVTTRSAKPEAAGVKFKVSVLPLNKGGVMVRLVDVTVALVIAPEKVISISEAVPPVPAKSAVTTWVAAWLGEANAKLARSTAANDRKTDRFIMETPGKLISKVTYRQLVLQIHNSFSSIPARLDLMTRCSSRNELGHRSDERDPMRTVKAKL